MASLKTVPHITAREILEQYDALLIDAYGVLVHSDGAFEGASTFIEHLKETQKPFVVITNDASRNSVTASASYESKGVHIPAERIITSGSLITSYLIENQLQGARCIVLGTEDSKNFVREAGATVVGPMDTDDVDVVLVCDDAGFPFLETVEAVISMLFRRFDAGKETRLLVANPDLIYQKNEHNVGLASGSIAMLIEQALQLRFLHDQFQFVRLGKPHPPIFEEAFKITQTRNMILLGDQLRTDICGANTYGIDSALVATGLVQLEEREIPDIWYPTYILPSLAV